MSDRVGPTSSSCVFPEDIFEDDNESSGPPAGMTRARRAALEALERELSEFLENARQ
jgi:hypothetical protein